MNKKDNPSEVLAARATIRYKMEEYEIVKQKAEAAGVSFSDFCRQMTIKGYVQAVHTSFTLSEMRELKSLLIQYKTNFSRISNLIRLSDPGLYNEIIQLKNLMQTVIDKIKL